MPEADHLSLEVHRMPQTAVEEARQLLSEREQTKAVLGTMLSQLEECSSQAANLEGLYSGLVVGTASNQGTIAQKPSELSTQAGDQSSLELAGLRALIQQKRQQLHELKLSSQGPNVSQKASPLPMLRIIMMGWSLTAEWVQAADVDVPCRVPSNRGV